MIVLPLPAVRLEFNGQTFYSQERLEKLENERNHARGLYHDALAGLSRKRRRLDREIRRRMAAERRATAAEAAEQTASKQAQSLQAANQRITRDRDAARTDASLAHARIRTLEAELNVADNRSRNASARADVDQRRAEDAESNVAALQARLRDAEARARHAEADERIVAWQKLAEHPFFISCFRPGGTLLDGMLAKLDQAHAAPAEIRLDYTGRPPFTLGDATLVPLPPAPSPSPTPSVPMCHVWFDGDGYSITASPARPAVAVGANIAAHVHTQGPDGVFLTEKQAREVGAHLVACAEYHATGGHRG